jgi:hypothetical protein
VWLKWESIHAIVFAQKTFVISAVVLICDARIYLEERRKQAIWVGRCCGNNRRGWNDTSHLGKWNRRRSTIIENDSTWKVNGPSGRRLAGQCRERNVRNGTGNKSVRRRINAFDACTRRVFLFKLRIVISYKAAEETTVILGIGVCQAWKAILINPITIGFVILLIPWIEDEESIRCWRAPNHNAIHLVGLKFGPMKISVANMMKVAQQEKWYPSPFVVTNVMYEQKGRSQFAGMCPGDGVHHTSGMGNGVESERRRHLFLSEIGSGHVDHHLPVWLHQAIGKLTLDRRWHDLRRIINQIFRDCRAKKFEIPIQMKASS